MRLAMSERDGTNRSTRMIWSVPLDLHPRYAPESLSQDLDLGQDQELILNVNHHNNPHTTVCLHSRQSETMIQHSSHPDHLHHHHLDLVVHHLQHPVRMPPRILGMVSSPDQE